MAKPFSQTLLTLLPWSPPPRFLTRIHSTHPTLRVISRTVDFSDTSLPSDLARDDLKDVTVLLTWRTFPPRDWLPKLRYVQLTSAGCNHVLEMPLFLETTKEPEKEGEGRGVDQEGGEVAWCTANGVHPPQIAEWVVMTFLIHQHHIPYYTELHKQERWIPPETDEDVEDAVGLTMGILGYGAIGRQCARLAAALGMKVHAYTFHPRPTPASRNDTSYTPPGLGDPDGSLPSKWYSGDLTSFLTSSLDILVLCTPLTPLTRNLISRPQLEMLRPKKTFISNIARGAVLNTTDLIHALDNDWIRGAALDVSDPEPLPSGHELWKAKNVIITPHVSGNSDHYNERVLAILEENLKRMVAGNRLVNVVDRGLGY